MYHTISLSSEGHFPKRLINSKLYTYITKSLPLLHTKFDTDCLWTVPINYEEVPAGLTALS